MVNPFGDNATVLLAVKRLKQNAVADAIGVHHSEVSDWLNPARPNKRMALLSALKLAAGLESNINSLVRGVCGTYDALFAQQRRRLTNVLTHVAPPFRSAVDSEIAWFCGGDTEVAAVALSPPSSSSQVGPSSTTRAVRSEEATMLTTRWLRSFVRSLKDDDTLVLLQDILATEIQARIDANEDRAAG